MPTRHPPIGSREWLHTLTLPSPGSFAILAKIPTPGAAIWVEGLALRAGEAQTWLLFAGADF
jgi:hypothetical protein